MGLVPSQNQSTEFLPIFIALALICYNSLLEVCKQLEIH